MKKKIIIFLIIIILIGLGIFLYLSNRKDNETNNLTHVKVAEPTLT